jgi:hypothetical protein
MDLFPFFLTTFYKCKITVMLGIVGWHPDSWFFEATWRSDSSNDTANLAGLGAIKAILRAHANRSNN